MLQAPAIPRNVFELHIPQMFQNTLRGEDFQLRDYNENNTRIFSTKRNLKVLRKCKQWQCFNNYTQFMVDMKTNVYQFKQR